MEEWLARDPIPNYRKLAERSMDTSTMTCSLRPSMNKLDAGNRGRGSECRCDD